MLEHSWAPLSASSSSPRDSFPAEAENVEVKEDVEEEYTDETGLDGLDDDDDELLVSVALFIVSSSSPSSSVLEASSR